MRTPIAQEPEVAPRQLNVSGRAYGKKAMPIHEAIKQTARTPVEVATPAKEEPVQAPVPETPKTATIMGWARTQAFIALRAKHFEIAKKAYEELWRTCLASNLDLKEVLNNLVHIEIGVQGDEPTK